MLADPVAVKAIFLEAAAIEDPVVREALLNERCGDNTALRGRVLALLIANDRAVANEGTMSYGDHTATADSDASPTASFPGKDEHIGAILGGKYKLIEEIGEGGMGSVYMAQQTEPVKRAVAVKVIKAGMDSKAVLARFEAERQALAMMDHPNIARVLDAGTTESGRPYFVMELVKGVPITQYCDERKLTPRQRLELFVPVCNAIQHAHQKGVIHRDIKPSNVLVAMYDDRPVPKVIDFGVAKAAGQTLTDKTLMTGFGAVVGTPEYMSPEQANLNNLDIDTRSDVYSLGVLLYELLTGSTPVDRKSLGKAALLEILRIVREVEAPRPSAKLSTIDTLPSVAANRGTEPAKLSKLMKGELDWVLLKALEKDRTRRYDTANGLARDIQRYLADEIVEARPPSTGYRVKKFVKRHKGQVIAGSLVIFALVAGVVGTTLGLLEARRQTGIAREQEGEAVTQAALARSEAEAKEQARAEEAKQRGVAEAEKKKAIEFRNKALDALRATTGEDVEKLLGEKKELTANEKAYLEAIAQRWQTFARQEGTDEQSRAIGAEGHFRVSKLWHQLGRREEARPEYEQAIALWGKLAADFPAIPDYRNELARSHNNLGLVLADLRRLAEAQEQYKKALALCEKLAADFPAVPDYRRQLGVSSNNQGDLLVSLGKRAEAEEQYKKALALFEKLVADFPAVPDYRRTLAGSQNSLGFLQAGLRKPVEAEEQYRKALAIREKLAADFPAVADYRRLLAWSHHNLGNLLADLERWAEAEEQYRKGLAIREKLATDFPSVPDYRNNLAKSHNTVGNLLTNLGKRAEAEEQFRKGQAIHDKLAAEFPTFPDYRRDLAASHRQLGDLFAIFGKQAEAEEQFRKGLAIHEKLAAEFLAVPDYRSELAGSHNNLGILLRDLGRLTDAEEQFRKGLAIREKLATDFPSVPDYRNNLAKSHNNLGVLLKDLGRLADAEEQHRKVLAIREKLATDFPAVPVYRVELGGSYCNFGNLIRTGGKPADSLAWYDKAIKTLRPVHEAEPRAVTAKLFLRNSHWGRAFAYDALGKHAEALQDWDKAVDLSPAQKQPAFRVDRAISRTRAGMVAEAVAEVAELTKSPNWSADQWYSSACVYSVASGKIADKKSEYADRAMELLAKAVKAGYKDAAHLKKDTDLDTLRDREDFKKVLTELEAKYPTPKEVLPPPRDKK